jgi:hypothetical protein
VGSWELGDYGNDSRNLFSIYYSLSPTLYPLPSTL